MRGRVAGMIEEHGPNLDAQHGSRHDGTGVDTVAETILLADDQPDLRMIYGAVLRRAGEL